MSAPSRSAFKWPMVGRRSWPPVGRFACPPTPTKRRRARPYSVIVTSEEVIARLNKDIWRPFIDAYAALDLDAFRAIHSADLVRVQTSTGWIGGRDEYMGDTAPRFAKARSLGDRFRISFRFNVRIVGTVLAYERGVFELTIERQKDDDLTFYGRFDTVSRFEDGVWRFILDKDDDEGGTVNVTSYRASASIDDPTPVRLAGIT